MYMTGKDDVFVDTLSYCPDYGIVEIPLVQGSGVQHKAVDIVLDDCFKVLSRGWPVAKQRCPSYSKTLPYEELQYPSQLEKSHKVAYTGCGAEVWY